VSTAHIDFRVRRCVHIALYTDTHLQLRKVALERGVSMQEMFQRFADLVVSGDKQMGKVLDELERDKLSGTLKRDVSKKLDQKGLRTIYDIIETGGDLTNSEAKNDNGNNENSSESQH